MPLGKIPPALALAASLLAAAPPARGDSGLRTYTDSFADNSGGWDLSDVGAIAGGKLTVEGGARVHIVQRHALFGPLSSLVVGEQYVGGGGDPQTHPDLAVIAFDVQDGENYYFLGINREGAYTVMAVEGGKPRKLIDWNKVPALKQGTGLNLVRIDVAPSLGAREFELAFNGSSMPLVVDAKPTLREGGDIALGAQNGSFAFSTLQLDTDPSTSDIWREDFSEARAGWQSASGSAILPENGAITLDGTGATGFALAQHGSGYDEQPGWISTTAEWRGGDPRDGGIGIAFAVTDGDTFYAFLVNPERGAIAVVAYIAGLPHFILPWSRSPHIPPSGALRLGVEPVATDDGLSVSLFVNGLRVGTALDESSRPLVTDLGLVAVKATGAFTEFSAYGPAAPAPLFPLSAKDVVDPFADNSLAWALDPPTIALDPAAHGMILDAREGERYTRPNLPLPGAPSALDVDATWTGGSPLGGYGMIFDVIDSQSFYLFEVAGSGAWQVLAVDAGKPRVVQKWQPSPVIVPRGRNVLTVKITPASDTSATLDFLVNGKSLGSFKEATPRFFCANVGLCSSVAGLAAQKTLARFAAIRFQGTGLPVGLAHGEAPATQPARAPRGRRR